MSQLAFAYKMMEDGRSLLNDDHRSLADLKRAAGNSNTNGGLINNSSSIKTENFASLYNLHSTDTALANAAGGSTGGGSSLSSRSLSDHSGTVHACEEYELR